MSDLNHRARKILAAIVHEYLSTGDAVGSRTVTRRHGIDLSPATVRNVMSDLEEAGMLKQPHTSAGRVPTDLGLRFFVDSLLKVRTPTPREREELQRRYALPSDDFEAALREASRQLAELSAHTVVLETPRPEVDVVEHVEFVRLRERQLLCVLVTKAGKVENKLVSTAEPLASDELERINNYLNSIVSGLTLDEMSHRIRVELEADETQYDTLRKQALELSAQALPEAGSQLIVEGQSNLLEAADVLDAEGRQRMKALFRALEEKRLVADLLARTVAAPGIQVFIGAESQIEELSDFTVVATSYGQVADDGQPLGTLGVIGPTRMNYSKVINLVDFTAQILSGFIGRR